MEFVKSNIFVNFNEKGEKLNVMETEKVFCYRNLHKKGVVWSVKSCKKNKVVGYTKTQYFKDVELKVSQKGRERVLREKRKNVHAGVKGFVISDLNEIQTLKDLKWVKVTYNPYVSDSFILQDGTKVYKAKYALLCSDGLFCVF